VSLLPVNDQTQRPSLAALAQQFKTWTRQRSGVSPLYEAIVQRIIADEELLALVAEGASRDYVQNRFMAAVHYLLLEGCHHPLSEYYATLTAKPAPVTQAYQHFKDFCFTHKQKLLDLVASREVQINEVRRCAALLPAFAWARQPGGNRPLALLDVGAAAGLNLLLDQFFYDYGPAGTVGDRRAPVRIACRLRGTRLPRLPKKIPRIAWRMGIDCHPVDVNDPHATNWMVALVSPDDNSRLSLLLAALAIARSDPPKIVKGLAHDILPGVLHSVPKHLPLCVFHTFTTHHFHQEELARFNAVLAAFSKVRDFHVISMEWQKLRGKPQTQLPIPIEALSFASGKRKRVTLGEVDNRGACEWLEWLQPRSG
jgi:hypothetical protein